MNTIQLTNLFGFTAAGISIVMFIPQALEIWKTKNTKSISLLSFLLFDIASVFWVTYGILLNALPVITVNIALIILNSFIVGMKLKYK